MKQLQAAERGSIGLLNENQPKFVTQPPIEAVVFAWGVNEDSQLGLEEKVNLHSPKVVEAFLGVRLSGRTTYRTPLVAGSRNSLAIDSDGQLWSWGWNDRATLGLGHRNPVSKPQRLTALAHTHIVQVAVNGWHCLALSDTGQVYAWGGNEYLQCGTEPEKRDLVLPSVPRLPQLKVRQIACGGMHSLVLTDEGIVWTWGEPWGDFSLHAERRPRPVSGAVGIAAIAAGAFHNMALSFGGQVFTWGTNDYGQLGNGHTTYDTAPTPVVDMEDIRVSEIAAGGWHSMAISAQGEVYAWGRGEYGRLGIGDTSGSSKLRPHKVCGLEGHKIVQVAAGGTHTLALSSEGRMWSWGRASFGRLGLGQAAWGKVDQYSPVEVLLPGGPSRWVVLAIAAGGRHSMCLALPLHDRLPGGSSAASDSGLQSEEVDGASEASLYCRDGLEPPGGAEGRSSSGGAHEGGGALAQAAAAGLALAASHTLATSLVLQGLTSALVTHSVPLPAPPPSQEVATPPPGHTSRLPPTSPTTSKLACSPPAPAPPAPGISTNRGAPRPPLALPLPPRHTSEEGGGSSGGAPGLATLGSLTHAVPMPTEHVINGGVAPAGATSSAAVAQYAAQEQSPAAALAATVATLQCREQQARAGSGLTDGGDSQNNTNEANAATLRAAAAARNGSGGAATAPLAVPFPRGGYAPVVLGGGTAAAHGMPALLGGQQARLLTPAASAEPSGGGMLLLGAHHLTPWSPAAQLREGDAPQLAAALLHPTHPLLALSQLQTQGSSTAAGGPVAARGRVDEPSTAPLAGAPPPPTTAQPPTAAAVDEAGALSTSDPLGLSMTSSAELSPLPSIDFHVAGAARVAAIKMLRVNMAGPTADGAQDLGYITTLPGNGSGGNAGDGGSGSGGDAGGSGDMASTPSAMDPGGSGSVTLTFGGVPPASTPLASPGRAPQASGNRRHGGSQSPGSGTAGQGGGTGSGGSVAGGDSASPSRRDSLVLPRQLLQQSSGGGGSARAGGGVAAAAGGLGRTGSGGSGGVAEGAGPALEGNTGRLVVAGAAGGGAAAAVIEDYEGLGSMSSLTPAGSGALTWQEDAGRHKPVDMHELVDKALELDDSAEQRKAALRQHRRTQRQLHTAHSLGSHHGAGSVGSAGSLSGGGAAPGGPPALIGSATGAAGGSGLVLGTAGMSAPVLSVRFAGPGGGGGGSVGGGDGSGGGLALGTSYWQGSGLGGEISSQDECSQEEEEAVDDDDAMTHISATSRRSLYHSNVPGLGSAALGGGAAATAMGMPLSVVGPSLARPVSPSHTYMSSRGLGAMAGSPIGLAGVATSLGPAGFASPLRITTASVHDQTTMDVAARLAASVVGSPRTSAFANSFTDHLGYASGSSATSTAHLASAASLGNLATRSSSPLHVVGGTFYGTPGSVGVGGGSGAGAGGGPGNGGVAGGAPGSAHSGASSRHASSGLGAGGLAAQRGTSVGGLPHSLAAAAAAGGGMAAAGGSGAASKSTVAVAQSSPEQPQGKATSPRVMGRRRKTQGPPSGAAQGVGEGLVGSGGLGAGGAGGAAVPEVSVEVAPVGPPSVAELQPDKAGGAVVHEADEEVHDALYATLSSQMS